MPVVVVALLVLLGLFLWRRRKQKKTTQEARRKEVEEYGYNPNDDPTLPAVGAAGDGQDMSEDASGYRGWGNQSLSNRKASTNASGLTAGHASSPSDGALPRVPSSPGNPMSSTAPLVGGAAGLAGGAALGAGAGAAAAAASDDDYRPRPAELEGSGVQRGPSNASSQYSTGGRTNDSTDLHQDYGYDHNYSQYTPYYNNGVGGFDASQQPVVRDVNAVRNTRVQNPGAYQPQQGISQNF